MAEALPSARVGHTALQVSRLGLGTAPLTGKNGSIPEAQSVETILAALAAGVTFIDTAPLYGAGRSEQRLSIALHGVARDSYVLSTKVGRLVLPDDQVVFDFSRDGVLRSFEESLKRLKLDRVDILLVHDPDDNEQRALEQAFPALAELRAQGMVGAIGAGMNQWQMEERFAENFDVDCFLLAGRYTLLEQTALEFLARCQERSIGIFLGGVFNSGILAMGARPGATYNYAEPPAAIVERVRRIEAICARYDVPLYRAAAQFALAHPAVTAVVLGAILPSEVRANRDALFTPIPSELWADLRREGLLREDAPTPA
ncbi:MAG TPA: aldo/keto reductase [Roseiflexaceae bacterium]|nr:aldo/keto reductase [Roseiflexaceae bacterium]